MKNYFLLFLLLALLLTAAGCGREVSQSTLTIEIEGTGQATPSEGSHEYSTDSFVEITAIPDTGWQFKEWTGEVAEAQQAETAVLMDKDKTVKAIFMEETDPGHLTFDSSTGTITDYNRKDGGPDVVIPSTLEGVTVSTIGNNAFEQMLLESVIIPDSVTSIGDYAFGSNGQLSSLKIGSNVSTIGNFAFHLGSLEEVILSEGLVTIGDFAFLENPLSSIVFPDSLTSIGMFAFASNSNLESITIGDNATIGEGAFSANTIAEEVENNFRDVYTDPDNGGAGTYIKQGDGTWLKN